MNNLPLHFEPHYYTHYQEYNKKWRKAEWKEIRGAHAVKRLQYNTQKYRNYLIIDLDHRNLDIYKYVQVPKPNVIVKNKDGSGAHYFYFLNRPVYFDTDEKDVKKRNRQYYNVKKWQHVMREYSKFFRGDPDYVGYIGKNMFSPEFDVEVIHNQEYSLNALEFYCDTEIEDYKEVKKRKQKSIYDYTTSEHLKEIEKGRNCALFNDLRFFAYREVKKIDGELTSDFNFRVEEHAKNSNEIFMSPLAQKEVAGICRSVIGYCRKNRYSIYNSKRRGIMNLSDSLTLKEKQRLGAQYSSKKKAEGSRLKIELKVRELSRKGEKITIKGIARETGLSINTVRKYRELLEPNLEEKGGVISVSYQDNRVLEAKKEEKREKNLTPLSFLSEAPTFVGATEIENGMLMSSNSQSKSPLVLKINEVKKKNERERPGDFSVKGHMSRDVRNLFRSFLESG